MTGYYFRQMNNAHSNSKNVLQIVSVGEDKVTVTAQGSKKKEELTIEEIVRQALFEKTYIVGAEKMEASALMHKPIWVTAKIEDVNKLIGDSAIIISRKEAKEEGLINFLDLFDSEGDKYKDGLGNIAFLGEERFDAVVKKIGDVLGIGHGVSNIRWGQEEGTVELGLT